MTRNQQHIARQVKKIVPLLNDGRYIIHDATGYYIQEMGFRTILSEETVKELVWLGHARKVGANRWEKP